MMPRKICPVCEIREIQLAYSNYCIACQQELETIIVTQYERTERIRKMLEEVQIKALSKISIVKEVVA
jgi:hypothetical protein